MYQVQSLIYLVFLDDAVLLVGRRRVPWHTDGRAVMAPYCQHCHLLRRRTRCWSVRFKRNKGNTQKKKNDSCFSSYHRRICTSVHILTASRTTRYFLSQCGRWLPQHISISYLNGRIFLHNWNVLGPKKIHHSAIILSLRFYYPAGIISYTHQAFEVQIVLY